MSVYPMAITPGCRQALASLRGQPFLDDFYLAGGTALALQLGHRISTDLDWFSASCRLLRARHKIKLLDGQEATFVIDCGHGY